MICPVHNRPLVPLQWQGNQTLTCQRCGQETAYWFQRLFKPIFLFWAANDNGDVA